MPTPKTATRATLPVPWAQSVTPIVVANFTNTVTEAMGRNRFFRLRTQ